MNEIAKWAWLIFLSVLFLGYWVFVILGVEIVAIALIYWLKPEWIDKMR